MKSVLRIYLHPFNVEGLLPLIEQATSAAASQHEEIVKWVRKLLREHAVLGRFSDEELKMGDLTYRCPIWIENNDVSFDILGGDGLLLDRRIASNTGMIQYFSVRHYFSVPAGKEVALGRGDIDAYTLIQEDEDEGGVGRSMVAWVVSYDPARDNPFRYRIDIESENLYHLSVVALKIIACEKIVSW